MGEPSESESDGLTRRAAFFGDDEEAHGASPPEVVTSQPHDDDKSSSTRRMSPHAAESPSRPVPQQEQNGDVRELVPGQIDSPRRDSPRLHAEEEPDSVDAHAPPSSHDAAVPNITHDSSEGSREATTAPNFPGYKSKSAIHHLSIDVSAEENSDNLHATDHPRTCLSRRSARINVNEILKGLPLCTVLNFNRLVMRLQARVRGAICRKERRMTRNFGKTGLLQRQHASMPHDLALAPAAASHACARTPKRLSGRACAAGIGHTRKTLR